MKKKTKEWFYSVFFRILKFSIFEVKEWDIGEHRYEIQEYVVCYGIKGIPFFWRPIESYINLKYAIKTKDELYAVQKNPNKKRRLKEYEEVLELM